MSEQEFLRCLRFETYHDHKTRTIYISATLDLIASGAVAKDLAHEDDAIACMKDHLKERLLRALYDDRRREFYQAFMDFMSVWVPRFDMCEESNQAREKLEQCLKRMAPGWAEERLAQLDKRVERN